MLFKKNQDKSAVVIWMAGAGCEFKIKSQQLAGL